MTSTLEITESETELCPARRGILDCFEVFFSPARKQRYAMYGYGTATDELKAAVLEEFHRNGDFLDRQYFLGLDNHELWIERKLVGLCNIFTDVTRCDEVIKVSTSLLAIFLLNQYRGNGLGSSFINCIWTDLRAGYTSIIAEAVDTNAEAVKIRLDADFESPEGMWIFNHLKDCIELYLETANAAFQINIELEVDAGY